MSINLYKNMYNQNTVTFNTVEIDMTDLQQNQISWVDNKYTTYAATGDIVHILRFNIELEGMNRVNGYDPDPDSKDNLCSRPSYQVTVGGTELDPTYTINLLPNSEAIQIGQKPDDWEAKYPTWYYTRRLYTSGNTTYILYDHASSTWDSTAQYYKDTTETIYYTGSMGSFGVSRFFGYLYAGSALGNAFREGIYVCLPTFATPYRPTDEACLFKAGGLFGNPIISPITMPVENQSIPFYVDTNIIGVDGIYTSTLNHLCQMCEFTYEVQDTSHGGEPYSDTFKGIIVIEVTNDNLPVKAYVVAIQNAFWTPIEKKSTGGPKSHAQGGQGTHIAPSDNRGDRRGATVANIVSNWNGALDNLAANQNRYRLNLITGANQDALNEMINTLWSPEVWDAITNEFFNPKDAVITCHFMPGKLGPRADNGADKIKAATKNLTTSTVPTFTNTFRDHHVGDIDISLMRDAFPDFDDTEIFIYLPYVGTYQLDITGCMDGWLAVDYATDVLTGDVTAYVTVCDTFGNYQQRYVYKGNCATQLDLYSRERTPGQAVAKTIGGTILRIGASALAGGISGSTKARNSGFGRKGGVLGQKNSFIQGATEAASAQALNSITNMKAANCGVGTVASNANGGAVTSPIDTQCWVLITRPEWSNPEGYGELFGFPSDIGGIIKDTFTGFLAVRTAFLDDIPCTDEEKSEIAQFLTGGVYLNKPVVTASST